MKREEENDQRWLDVTDDTPVLFDDELSTFGELAGNERQTLSFNTDGVLEGGFTL